jgi:predicted enzyme related to lactoylglutathione lyase
MNLTKQPLFKYVDCIQLYIPDLQQGMEYYCNSLGLRIIWKTDTAIGLGTSEGITEIVIQNERNIHEVDIKVDSVLDAVAEIESAGGRIVYGPFDIPIGKAAVVKDPWDNQLVLLDTTKGTYITDDKGNILGHNEPS